MSTSPPKHFMQFGVWNKFQTFLLQFRLKFSERHTNHCSNHKRNAFLLLFECFIVFDFDFRTKYDSLLISSFSLWAAVCARNQRFAAQTISMDLIKDNSPLQTAISTAILCLKSTDDRHWINN